MYSAADSTTGCTEGEVDNETACRPDLTLTNHTEFKELKC